MNIAKSSRTISSIIANSRIMSFITTTNRKTMHSIITIKTTVTITITTTAYNNTNTNNPTTTTNNNNNSNRSVIIIHNSKTTAQKPAALDQCQLDLMFSMLPRLTFPSRAGALASRANPVALDLTMLMDAALLTAIST